MLLKCCQFHYEHWGQTGKRSSCSTLSFQEDDDLHFGVSHGFARDVSLHLGLVDPIDTGPDKRASKCDCPEGVPPQWTSIKAIKERQRQRQRQRERERERERFSTPFAMSCILCQYTAQSPGADSSPALLYL